jgi:anthranilate phosphoribosyltransferase
MTTDVGWPDVLSGLIARRDLSSEQTGWAMRQILSGEASPAQIAGFAVALRAKGETVSEVEGLVATMYEFAAPCDVPGRTVDIVGTGGDRSRTVNISTMAALVAAGAGVPVVKHGNRAASSACGSADVLEGLGVRLDLAPDRVAAIAAEVGITFCFAPVFHAALRHSASTRRDLGVATTFNFLGPLANPSRPSAQAVGVADLRMAEVIAGVLAARGVDGFVFRGDDGLDEITTTTTSRVWSISAGKVTADTLNPADLGIPAAEPADLVGGDVAFNTAVVRRLLAGEPGAVRDAVLLNAAAGIAAYDAAEGSLVDRLGAGLARATAAVDSGAAERSLSRWLLAVAAD